MVSKITATIETVPTWGDDNFDANVHENFLKLKALGPQLNKTVEEINQTLEDIDTYTKTASTKAGEAAQSANTANSAKQTATQQAEIASTKAGEAAQSASTANSAKQTATQQAEIASTKASEVNNIKNEMIEVIEALQSDPLTIIASQELGKKINISDMQDTLDSNSIDKPLSANQGRVLKEFIDAINGILSSDDTTLDELQEIVSFIKQNKSTLDNLSINNIAGLPSALSDKITKVISTDNAISRFDGTTGDIQSSGVIIDDNNDIVTSSTTSAINTKTGRLLRVGDFGIGSQIVSQETNLNNYNISGKYITPSSGLINLPNGWEQTRYIIDVSGGVSYASQLISSTNYKRVALRTFNGTFWSNWLVIGDPLTKIENGQILSLSPNGGIGYGAGSGGVVTQLVSKETAVTLNKPCGRINTFNSSMTAGASTSFILDNSLLKAGDTINLTNTGWASYDLRVGVVLDGQASIHITNTNIASQAHSIPITFTIIKGSFV